MHGLTIRIVTDIQYGSCSITRNFIEEMLFSLACIWCNFRNQKAAVKVTVDGVDCVVDTMIDTAIVCTTGAHPTSISAPVHVTITSYGQAVNVSTYTSNSSSPQSSKHGSYFFGINASSPSLD